MGANGSFTYTPQPLFIGSDSFQYVATDGTNVSVPATVTILVTDVAPVAVPDTYGVHPGLALTVPGPGVLANDLSPNGGPLQAVTPQISGPNNGILLLNWDGSFTYAPNAGFIGTDSFTYEATDSILNSSPATVTLDVHSSDTPPGAINGSYVTGHDQNLYISAPGVLSNLSDAYSDPLTAVLTQGTTNGTVSLFEDGSFQYTPNPGFVGSDSFAYAANDGLETGASATILIAVTNAIPNVTNGFYLARPGMTLTVAAPGVLFGDTDADNDPLTAQLIGGPVNGALILNSDGSFTYTPFAGFIGADTFLYAASNGFASSPPAAVTIDVINEPPVAVADLYGFHAGLPLLVAAPGVLENDSDPQGSALTASLVQSANNGTVTLNPDGSFFYQPAASYIGPDSFSYVANDGFSISQPTVVSLMVHAINSPPVAAAADFQVQANDSVLAEVPFSPAEFGDGALSGDADPDNDPMTAVLVSGPTNAVSFNLNPDGTFNYLPNIGFTGTDSFTYEAFDGLVDSSPATVTLSVSYTPPVVSYSAYTIHFNTPLSVPAPGVLADIGVSDSTVGTLSGTLLTLPASGSLAFQTNGAFTYTPSANFVGQDQFTYQPYDGVESAGVVPVMITVTDMPPMSVDDAYYAVPGGSLTVGAPGVLGNDSDPDGDPLLALLASGPTNAAVFQLNPDGSFLYAPRPNFTGTDAFYYVASDGAMLSLPAEVVITVSSVPVVQNSVYIYTPGVPLVIGATNGVLQNSFDPTGTGISAKFAGGTGLVSLHPDGSFVFQSPSSASGPITFEYEAEAENGAESAPASCQMLAAVPAPAKPNVALIRVYFSGGTDLIYDLAGSTYKENSSYYLAPHWMNSNGDGIINPKVKDRAYPYSYVLGATPTIAATFVTNDSQIPATIKIKGTLYNKDTAHPLGITVTGNASYDKASGWMKTGPIKASGAFPSEVGALTPLLIEWEYGSEGDPGEDYWPCGESTNFIYITLATPAKVAEYKFKTVLDIGCRQGAGATKASQLLAAGGGLWKYFAGRKVQRADGTDLTYYNDWGTMNVQLCDLLKTTDGQCGAWARLLRAVYGAQGITTSNVQITGIRPNNGSMLVNTWKPKNAAGINKNEYVTPAQPPPWPRQTGAGKGKYLFTSADITYVSGAGQNNNNPAADFALHYIVQIVIESDTNYFDPSYGNTYAGIPSIETQALAGYFELKAGKPLAPSQYIVETFDPKKPPGKLKSFPAPF
jgi:hypothetical protein